MLFRLEVEAHEEKRLATMAHRASTTNEQEFEPATTTTTTEERQEGSAPANTNRTQDQQPVNTTLPEPLPTNNTLREAAIALHSAGNPSLPTPPPPPVPDTTNVTTSERPPDQPEQPHTPEDILVILEED